MRFLVVLALLCSALFAQCQPRHIHHHSVPYRYDPVIHRAVPIRIVFVPVRVGSRTQFVPVQIVGTHVFQVCPVRSR